MKWSAAFDLIAGEVRRDQASCGVLAPSFPFVLLLVPYGMGFLEWVFGMVFLGWVFGMCFFWEVAFGMVFEWFLRGFLFVFVGFEWVLGVAPVFFHGFLNGFS